MPGGLQLAHGLKSRGTGSIQLVNLVLPRVEGTPEIGNTLTALPGLWTDTDPISYAYQWLRNGQEIIGATADSHTIVDEDGGAELRVRVTTTDTTASIAALSGEIAVPAASVATPIFIRAPGFGATGYEVGETVTFDMGATAPDAPLSVETFALNGADRTGALSGIQWTSTGEAPGTISLRIGATNSGGTTLSDTVTVALGQVAAPSFAVQPGFGAASYEIGDIVTFDEGQVDPSATLTVETFTLGGADKSGELSGTLWDSTGEAAGTLALRISATNPGGTTLSTTVNAALTEAVERPASFLAYASMRHISDAETPADGLQLTGWQGTPSVTYYVNDVSSSGGASVSIGDTVYAEVSGTDEDGVVATSTTQTITVLDQIATSNATSHMFPGDSGAVQWNTSLPKGRFVLGEPAVVSSSATNVTAYGDADGGMLNPFVPDGDAEQGFSSATWPNLQGGNNAYNSALDATTGYTAISRGDSTMMVLTADAPGFTSDSWGIFDKYRPLTFLSKAPPAGAFRPGMSDTANKIVVTDDDIDLSAFRSLSVGGVSGIGSYADVLAAWRNPIGAFGPQGERQRRIEVFSHIKPDNYSADLSTGLLIDTHVHLHSSANSTAEKRALARLIVQAAIDIAAVAERGQLGSAGAGQRHFYGAVLMTAVACTGSAALWEQARRFRWNLDQAKPVTEADLASASAWTAGNEGGEFQFVRPITRTWEGRVLWAKNSNTPDGLNSAVMFRTYLDASGRGRLAEMPGLYAMKATSRVPAGPLIVSNGADPNSLTENDRAAMLHFVDQEMTMYPHASEPLGGNQYISAQANQWYSLTRPLTTTDYPIKDFPPMPPEPFEASAGTLSVSWDFSTEYGNDYGSTLPLTGFEVLAAQFSGIQFHPISSSVNGSAPVAPIDTYVTARLQNSEGWGERSWAEQDIGSGGVRNLVSPTGSTPDAITNIAPPKFMVRDNPTPSKMFVDAADDALTPFRDVFIGDGFWAGNIGAATPNFNVQVETSPGSGTGTAAAGSVGTAGGISYYAIPNGEGGKRIRVGATLGGTGPVYSPWLAIAETPPYPAGTLIDTTFDAEAAAYHGAEFAVADIRNGTGGHEPGKGFSGFQDIGAFGVYKNASFPNAAFVLAEQAIPGVTYEVKLEYFLVGGQSGRDFQIRVRGPTRNVLEDHGTITEGQTLLPMSWSSGTRKYTLKGNFTLPTGTYGSTPQTLDLWVQTTANAGGTAGGDIFISKARIVAR